MDSKLRDYESDVSDSTVWRLPRLVEFLGESGVDAGKLYNDLFATSSLQGSHYLVTPKRGWKASLRTKEGNTRTDDVAFHDERGYWQLGLLSDHVYETAKAHVPQPAFIVPEKTTNSRLWFVVNCLLIAMVVAFVFAALYVAISWPISDDVALAEFQQKFKTTDIRIDKATNDWSGVRHYDLIVDGRMESGECSKSGAFAETICSIE